MKNRIEIWCIGVKLMTNKFEEIRLNLRTKLESIYHFWKEWLQKHPGILRIYTIFSWISLIGFILSLIFMEDSRKMFVQFFWSFYVILQFWLLCRSKTLSWKKYMFFFLAGAWLIVPLNSMFVLSITAIFGGDESDLWSQAFLTPISEEVLKLIPIGAYLFLSRRASTLSLSDYALIGAATGAGFQFLEETARRLVSGAHYGVTLLQGKVLHWDLFTLFPGYFEEGLLPDKMSAGHSLLTAMVTLGIGLAVRFKSKLKRTAYIFPVILLVWATFDHAIWNAGYRVPDWLTGIHKLLGSGYAAKPVFLMMLSAALIIDYWELNRVREQIPLLEGEKNINPVIELRNLGHSLIKDRRRFGYFLYFYRERRELGFTLLHGNKEAKEQLPILMTNVHRYYHALTLMIAVLLFSFVFVGWESLYSSQDACFACLFDNLQNWWDRLSVLEKGIILGGAFALSVPFLGVWSAIGAISAGLTVAASGHQIAEMIRNPRKLLTPEYAVASALTLGMSRLPFGKIVAKKVLKTAKGLEKYELTTAGGLTYRTTLGSKGEIRSIFAKIEPRHIDTGTETNKASRKFARLLGKKTDDAGHGIGRKLGGLGTKYSGNIFPQDKGINRGRFMQFEKMIADEVLAGKDVFVRIVPKYAAGSTRPTEVLYSVRIDGETISRIFPNP